MDTGLVAALAAVALLLRLPYYALIPAFTDETAEIYRGLLITQGKDLPLTARSTYKGSLWAWLVAFAFWASGNSIYAPRALILALGVLTVVATYLLGRAWGGRAGGLLAAALLSTAGGHIAVNSHVAWGSSATPLFTTLGTWALYQAVRERNSGARTSLLLSGVFWGLALQLHPSVLALLLGALAFVVWRGSWLFQTRSLYVAGGLFALVNANLVLFNLTSGFRSISESIEHSAHYTQDQTVTPLVYLDRVGLFMLGLLQNLAGAVDPRRTAADFLLDPGLWPIALLAAAAVVWHWRRSNPLPGLLVASMALILPLFNDKYAPILNGRYLAPLLPILYAATGALLATALQRFSGAGLAGNSWLQPPRLVGQIAVLVASGFLLLHPLLYLRAYYENELRIGRTNAAFFETLQKMHAHRRADETVVVVRPRREFHMGPGNGLASSAFHLSLAVDSVPYRILDQGSAELLDPKHRCREQLVITASRDASIKQEIVTRLGLRGLDGGPAQRDSGSSDYGLYRLHPLPGAPADC